MTPTDRAPQSRSNSAIDSTCDVCGNMLTTPAPSVGSPPRARARPHRARAWPDCRRRTRCAWAAARAALRNLGQRLRTASAPSRGGSIRNLSKGPSARNRRREFEQVAAGERRTLGHPIRFGVLARPLISTALPSIPTTSREIRASGSVKLPSPQNRSSTRSRTRRRQQPQGAAHEHAVDLMVHLGEVGRLERHADAEFRQRVVEPRIERIERRTVSGPFGCNQNCTLCSSANSRSSARRRR